MIKLIKIKGIENEDCMHCYTLEISPTIHNELITFFYHLKFDINETDKLDIIFSELNGAYLHIKNKDTKVHFFIANNVITMVIDTDKTQKELYDLMKKEFIFPKELTK